MRQVPCCCRLLATQAPSQLSVRALYVETTKRTPHDRREKGYWRNQSNLLKELDLVEHHLHIEHPEDWYTVTLVDLHAHGFPKHVSKPKLAELLEQKYPKYTWEKLYLLKGRYALQSHLCKILQSIFHDATIHVNARKEAGLYNLNTNDYLELDFYIPSHHIAFEFQERHHFSSVYNPLEQVTAIDDLKKRLADEKGITLIAVPFWWDRTPASLLATIKEVRPDLRFPQEESMEFSQAIPIPLAMPAHFLDKRDTHQHYVADIGQPIAACFFTASSVDPFGWWMFEKYDGVRAFWNPTKRAFYSRRGNVLPIPQHIVDTMPSDIFLDGELWFGRDNFQEAIKISNRVQSQMIDWTKFKYMVFDIPNHTGNYQERYSYLADYLDNKKMEGENDFCIHTEVASKEVCKNMHHLEGFFQDILDKGGEGIILRDPSAPYREGRSPGFLKHKKYRDAEAKITRSIGKHSWECELPNGVTFVAAPGTTEFTKRWNPQPGDIVSFKHHGYLLASKKPKFPTLHRIRTDIAWDDVVHNWKEQSLPISDFPVRKTKLRKQSKGHWESIANRRRFLENFAEELSFDSSKLENWEKVSLAQLNRKKGKTLINKYGTLKNILAHTFPEMNIPKSKPTPTIIERKPPGYWRDRQNRRAFCLSFAKANGFDPLDAQKWQSVTIEQVRGLKGGRTILGLYNESLLRALRDTFPEISFIGKDETTGQSYWSNPKTCRQFFDRIAHQMGANPLYVNTWYGVPLRTLTRQEGADSIKKHNGGLREALMKAFPELDFSRWQQQGTNRGVSWRDSLVCRQFFDRVALEANFNPLEPDNWYNTKLQQLKTIKHGKQIKIHNGGFKKALMNAYPNVTFAKWMHTT